MLLKTICLVLLQDLKTKTIEVTFQNILPCTSTGLKTHEVNFHNNLPGTSTGLETKTNELTFEQEKKENPNSINKNKVN